jgi:hypothetical protein
MHYRKFSALFCKYSYILVPRALLTRGQRRGALAKSEPDTMLWYPVWIFAWAPRRWPRVRRALGKRMIFILTAFFACVKRLGLAFKLASNILLEVAFQWYSFHWFWFTRLWRHLVRPCVPLLDIYLSKNTIAQTITISLQFIFVL